MKRKINVLLFELLCLTTIFGSNIFAKENLTQATVNSLSKVEAKITQTLCNIGNWTFWANHYGQTGHNPFTGSSGGFYPRGTANAVYMDGVIWGGYVREGASPRLRVGGIGYRIGTVPGWIISPGIAVNPDDVRARLYRIRSDWKSLTDSQVKQDAAELNNVAMASVTTDMTQAVISQYKQDWKEWPVDLGAPYYDIDGNGAYNPVLDEDGCPKLPVYNDNGALVDGGDYPGLANADQVLWMVVNDLDEGAVVSHSGSPTIGIELQITLWAYNQPATGLGQIVFKRYRLINKSGTTIDSMFVAQYSDPDIGDYSDDYAGCDPSLELAYAYNSNPVDAEYSKLGLTPAAMGYSLLQGPIVPAPGDIAKFNFKEKENYKNLPMTSFFYFAAGGIWSDPPMGVYDFTLQWYNMLNGYAPTNDTINPTPYTHGSGNNTGQPTKFPLDGDPLLGIGDIDGRGTNMSAADRRMGVCSGPFTMQPGDSQEVIIAIVGGIAPGGNHLLAITDMKNNLNSAKTLYNNGLLALKESHQIRHPLGNTTNLQMQVNFNEIKDVSKAEIDFAPQIGSESSFKLTLFDDGLHSDDGANDNIWGNYISMNNRKYPFEGKLIITRDSGQQIIEEFVKDLRLRPIPLLKDWNVIWENARQDLQVNPNETVRLSFNIYNTDILNSASDITITNCGPSPAAQTILYNRSIPAGGAASNDDFFLTLSAPAEGDSFEYSYRINFNNLSEFVTVTYPLAKWNPHSFYGDTLTVKSIQGSTNHVFPIVADPALLTGHSYLITFLEGQSETSLNWNLKDQNDNIIKADNIEASSDPLFAYPVVDGILFKVVAPSPGVKNYSIPSGTRRFTYLNGAGDFGFESLWGALGWDRPAHFFGSEDKRYPANKLKTVLLKLASVASDGIFSPNDENASYGYRFLRRATQPAAKPEFEPYIINKSSGYAYQNYTKSVPLAAYDVTDPQNPRRLVLGYLENNAPDGLVNGKYWPPYYGNANNTASSGPREWLFIYDVDYTEVVNIDLAVDAISTPNLPIMYMATWARRYETAWSPNYSGEDQFLIIPEEVNSAGDMLIVDAPTGLPAEDIPRTFTLSQNYPNPFNPVTNIKFTLANKEKVKIEVFNVLGQRIRTLIDKPLSGGEYTVKWDGRNDQGNMVASGIYLYRLKAGEFVQTRKMVLMR